jgi:hypothetical protein
MAPAVAAVQVLLGQPEQIMLEEMAAQVRPHLFLVRLLPTRAVAVAVH